MIENKRKNNGITLVALVVTIIILLILAGITISSLTNTGIFEKAKSNLHITFARMVFQTRSSMSHIRLCLKILK